MDYNFKIKRRILTQFQKNKKELDDKYELLKNNYNNLNNEFISYKNIQNETKKKYDEILIQYYENKKEKIIINDKYIKLQNEFSELMNNKRCYESKINELSLIIKKLTNEINELKVNKEILEKKIKCLKENNQIKQEKINDLVTKAQFLKEMNEKLKGEKEELNININTLQNDYQKVIKYKNNNINNNYIIASYEISADEINKEIQILNCCELNKKEIEESCELFLYNHKIKFNFKYKFEKKGKYTFKFIFNK